MVCLSGFWFGVFAVIGTFLAATGAATLFFVFVEVFSPDPDLR
jgi:hypothetical protein